MGIIWSAVTISSRLMATLGLIWLLARDAELGAFGLLMYQLTVITVIGVLVDFGFNLRLSRDLALKEDSTRVVPTVVVAKALISSVVFISIVIFFTDALTLTFVILFLAMVCNIIASTSLPIFRAGGRFKEEALHVTANNLLTVVSYVLLSYFNVDSVLAFCISMLVGKILFFVLFVRRFKTSLLAPLYRYSYLFGNASYLMHGAVGVLYVNIDTLLIKEVMTYEDVGLYQVASKSLLAACFVTEIFGNFYMTRLAKAKLAGVNEFKRQSRSLLLQLISFGVLSAGSFFLLMYYFAPVVFSAEFSYNFDFLAMLALVVFIRYVGIYPGLRLTLDNAQRYRVFGGLSALIVMGIALRPSIESYGLSGAAAVLLLAHVVLNFVYLYGILRAK